MENQGEKALEGPDEYYSIPEEALQYLPDEWRKQLEAVADDGRAVLKSVDADLSRVSKLTSSYVAIESLRHVQDRLAQLGFAATMEHFLELDMLTLAFVVTYSRLHDGGVGGGFARDHLPEKLRPVHDEIIELRNKRFAHNTGHHSVADALEIQSDTSGEWFNVKLGYTMRFQIGGNPLWKDIVDTLDEVYATRMGKLLSKISEKTGRNWAMESAPSTTSEDSAAVQSEQSK